MVQLQPRRGRRVVQSDDEEATAPEPTHAVLKQTKLATRPRHSDISLASSRSGEGSRTTTPTVTPKTTPKKAKGRPSPTARKAAATSKPGKKTIYSFFNATTQKQSEPPEGPEEEEEEEEIEQVEEPHEIERQLTSFVPNGDTAAEHNKDYPKKRNSDVALLDGPGSSTQSASRARQKLFKKQDGSRIGSPATPIQRPVNSDFRPWTEKYAPNTFEELVVHKKKATDVRNWLEASLRGQRHKRLLVLKGAAGSGKTATVTALSRVLNFHLIDWKNPSISDGNSGNYMSISSQFDDFLGRGRAFGSLEIVTTTNGNLQSMSNKVSDSRDTNRSQVLLVEEFPNNITRSTDASRLFRASILQFLATPTSQYCPSTPLVMIISESSQNSFSSSVDSFTAHRLLGSEILHHPSTTVLEFNAVAPTFIAKALSLVLQKRSREIGRYQAPGPDVLNKLSEFGDVRNATSALEFICLHAHNSGNAATSSVYKGRSSRTPRSKSRDAQSAPNASGDGALSLISLRESSLGLFHAVGKVMYNKRIPLEQSTATKHGHEGNHVPEHLTHHMRPLTSEVNVDSLLDETGTDTSTFLSALHENYIFSCNSTYGSAEATMDAVQGSLDALCDADILCNTSSGRSAQYADSSESMRQSDLAFHVATKGLLFSLPHPVKRQLGPGYGKADAHRMFYPTALKLWRKREEIHDLNESLTAKAMNGTLLAGVDMPRIVSGHLIDHPKRKPLIESTERGQLPGEDTLNHTACNIGSGTSATQEMLTERLPYLVHILRRSRDSHALALNRQIEKVTHFTGVKMLQGDEDDDHGDNVKAGFDNMPDLKNLTERGLSFGGSLPIDGQTVEELDVQRLVLIDDDIEDD